ncbi:unnamed protein product [Calypogeia fissa]
MPASVAVLAPPPLQLPPEEAEEVEVEVDNGEKGKPESMATQTRTIGLIDPLQMSEASSTKQRGLWLGMGPKFERRIVPNEKGNEKFNLVKSEDRTPTMLISISTPCRSSELIKKRSLVVLQLQNLRKVVQNNNAAPKESEVTKADNNMETKPVTKRNSWLGTFGKNFLKGRTNREHSSPQFYFLEPTYSMSSFSQHWRMFIGRFLCLR